LYNDVLTKFQKDYSYDLITECFGIESKLYAEDFIITKSIYNKYIDIIETNIDIIKGKKVIDVGAGSGMWSILMLLSGATNVIAVEPRDYLYNGLRNTVEKHNLNIKCIKGFHNDIEGKYDTVILSGILGLIPERVEYLETLGNHGQYIFIRNAVHNISENCVEVNLRHNNNYMQGYNLKQPVLNDLGYQTTTTLQTKDARIGQYLKHKFGTNYFYSISQYLGYSIHRRYIANGNQYYVLKTI